MVTICVYLLIAFGCFIALMGKEDDINVVHIILFLVGSLLWPIGLGILLVDRS